MLYHLHHVPSYHLFVCSVRFQMFFFFCLSEFVIRHLSSSLQILCPIKSSFSKFFWSHFFAFFSNLVYLYDWCVLLLTWYLIITMLLVTNPYMSSPCQGWFYKPGTNAFDNLALPVYHWLFQTSTVMMPVIILTSFSHNINYNVPIPTLAVYL